MNFKGTLFLTALLTGVFINGTIDVAEARRGSRGSGATSADVDLTYTFSVFDTTPSEENIPGCVPGSNSCLFKDSISDLFINNLSYLRDGTLDEVFIGTSNQTLFSQTYTPGITDFNPLINDLALLPASLGLRSEWNGSNLIYEIVDNLGETVEVTGRFSVGASLEEETRSLRAFSLRSESGERPDDRLINSIDFIVDTLRGEESLDSNLIPSAGFTAAGEFPFEFSNVDTNSTASVPEPSSIVGLFVLSLFGASYAQRKRA